MISCNIIENILNDRKSKESLPFIIIPVDVLAPSGTGTSVAPFTNMD